MFSESEVRAIYDKLDKKLSIDTTGIPIVFAATQGRTVGSCYFANKRGQDVPIKIVFNTHYDQRLSAASWEDVAKHEYAHAAIAILTGKNHNHDTAWQQLCIKIGCRPKAYTYNINVPESVYPEVAEDGNPIEIFCRKCGAKFPQSAQSRLVKLLNAGIPTSNYMCPHCGGMIFGLNLTK